MAKRGRKKMAFPPIAELADDIQQRWLIEGINRSQKAALQDWRVKETMPGGAARFKRAGGQDLRIPGPWHVAPFRRPLVASGTTENLYIKRKTRTEKAPGSTGSKFPNPGKRITFGGGVLNFLKNRKGLSTVIASTQVVHFFVRQHTVSAHTRQGHAVTSYTRSGHPRSKKEHTRRKVESQQTFGDAYKVTGADSTWIEKRYNHHLKKYRDSSKVVRYRGAWAIRSPYLKGVK